MKVTYDSKKDMYICTNDFVEIIGTKWISASNCNEEFINIALFYEDVIHSFDINIFTTQNLNMELFTEYCKKLFEENKEFSEIYNFMKTLTETAFDCFDTSKISVFCRRKKLLTKSTIICYGEFKDSSEPFNLISKSTTAPLNYPGTRRDVI